MAFSVKLSDISREKLEIITSMLCLQPSTLANKYNKNNVIEPILFYFMEGGNLHIPYLFGSALFQVIPNLDIQYPTVHVNFKGSLRENQVAVEKEAWEQLQTKGTSTLGLYPGFGKTILGARLSSRTNLVTVILVHREILTTQWKKTFEDFTTARVWIVGENNPPSMCDVIICMNTRWHIIPASVRNQVGFLIIDEAHAFCTPTNVGCLLAFHPKYILIESATLERDDEMEAMIYAIAGEHGVFREFNSTFNILKINTNTVPERKLNRAGDIDYLTLVSSTLFNERRNNIIADLTVQNSTCKILILTSLVDHALLIHKMLIARGIHSDCLCGSKKCYQDATVLVGTISKIGTGFDQATFCPTYDGRPFDLLILVASIKKTSVLVQNIGRLFRSRKVPTLFHLVDRDDIFKSHWYRCRKWYLKHGGVISEYNIPNPNEIVPQTIAQMQQQWIASKTLSLSTPSTSSPSSTSLNPLNPLNIPNSLHSVQ